MCPRLQEQMALAKGVSNPQELPLSFPAGTGPLTYAWMLFLHLTV